MRGIPTDLILPTLSTRLLGRLVVVVHRPGLEIADKDWRTYVQWLKELQEPVPEIGILIAAGGLPPSAAQRSWVSRELNTDAIRLAILLSDPKVAAMVGVLSWFHKGIAAFKAHEVDEALAFLGERGSGARVRTTIRELGGVVYTTAATG